MTMKYFVSAETIFCDYESDPEILDKYFSRWLHSLRSVANITIPDGVFFRHFLYISSDKLEFAGKLRDILNALPDSQKTRFVIVPYDHPVGGYGYDEDSHPDQYKNPNKSAPNRDRLFERALSIEPVPEWERSIRLTLDDDDLWAPWHLSEIVRAADLAYDPDKVVGVGLENAIIAYIDKGVADIVGLNKAMNGNKFYVSDNKKWSLQTRLSPWSIPESFDPKNVTRMSKAGVTLTRISGNRPGWVYGRWGTNLSGREKHRYYSNKQATFNFSDVNKIFEKSVHSSDKNLSLAIERLSSPQSVERKQSLRIFVPSSFLRGNGDLFAVFRTPNGREQRIFKIQRGKIIDLPQSGFLDQKTDWVGHIQLRPSDGPRAEVTPRARLSALNSLLTVSPNDLVSNAVHYSERQAATIQSGFSLSSWLLRPDVVEKVKTLATANYEQSALAVGENLLESLVESGELVTDSLTHSALSYVFSLTSLHIGDTETRSLPATSSHQREAPTQAVKSLEIEYEVDASPGMPLLVFLHGRKSEKVKLPYLVGRGMSEGHPVSRLSISDPSLRLSSENTISWYAGNRQQKNLQKRLVSLVREVADKSKASRIVFVGGSAGGYAALVLATYFPDSVALIWNPQTDIFRYYQKFVNQYVDTCWGGDASLLRNSAQTTVVGAFNSTGPRPTILYMQEPTDTHHVHNHLTPFISGADDLDHILVYNKHWGEGHIPPPKEFLHAMIDVAISADPRAGALSMGFVPGSVLIDQRP
ncbi:alpha/beta hydrolase family protein [Corynebacterium coyleae]